MRPVVNHFVLGILFASIIVLFDLWARNRMDKKKRFIIKCLLAGIFGTVIILSTMRMNPPVYATIKEDTIVFQPDERIKFSKIESIKYFEDTKIELVSNGFRWGSDDYFSGDANIRFLNTNGTEKESVYKCKAYLHSRSNDYILIELKNSTRSYVFNFDDEKETKKFYNRMDSFYKSSE